MNMNRVPVILDGDPGHDDAIAWVFAKADPNLDILAVTSVAGNQTIEKTTINARRICALLGIDAPFARGATRPLTADPVTAGNWHGESGLDGPAMPEPDQEISPLSAPDLMAKVIEESAEPVVIIPTGPLTNIAMLLLTHPEVKEKIRMITLMGGGVTHGNWKPAAEFNIFEDPEAAKIVYDSGIPIRMCGLDVTEKAIIRPDDFPRIRAVGNQVADIVAGWLEFFYQYPMAIGYDGAPVHDPCAVLAFTHPEIFTLTPYYVDIELGGEYARGATVADFRGTSGKEPNALVAETIDRDRYIDLLIEALHAYDGRTVTITGEPSPDAFAGKKIEKTRSLAGVHPITARFLAEAGEEIWIDTDTGVDDAAALITAAALEKKGCFTIAGISTVFGNAAAAQCAVNARNVLSQLGREDIPVYHGAERPMLVPARPAAYVHGENGLNGAVLPQSKAPVQEKPAWDAIYEAAKKAKGSLTLILLGPQTNAALAFRKYPDLPGMLKRIVIMGGADIGGNRTPAAEFNIWADPDSAQAVFKSGVPVVMCGLDVTEKLRFTKEDLEKAMSGESKGSRLLRTIMETGDDTFLRFYEGTPVLHDVTPILLAAMPELFAGEEAGVFVETRSGICNGKTVSDRDTDVKFGVKNTFVVLDADRETFVETVCGLVREA